MIFAALSEYFDASAFWKVVAVTLLASIIVPVAFSIGISGEVRREAAARAGQRTSGAGVLMIGLAAVVCIGAVAIGLWAMLQK